MNDVLQCTALTPSPSSPLPSPTPTHDDALPALVAMDDGPDPDPYLLCELGQHDEHTEHAAYLGPAGTPNAPALWLFWTGSGTQRVHRVANAPWCPAVLRRLRTGVVQWCAFFDRHTAPHSWSVSDPLGDLLAAQLVSDDSPDDSAAPSDPSAPPGPSDPPDPSGRPQP